MEAFTSQAAGLVFLGVIVSLIITIFKAKFKMGTSASLLLVAVISLAGAGAYVGLTHFGYWQAVWNILLIAGAFYAYITKNIKDALPTPQSEI